MESFLFPGSSHSPEFHVFENYICPGCGVVSSQPELTDEALAEHYNSTYRHSRDAIKVNGKDIDSPIDMTVGGRSMARVRNFHDVITANAGKLAGVVPEKDDLVIDFGAYQGMFLHGVKLLWDCRCLAYDYSQNGINFAKDFLGFELSKIADDIYTDTFDEKAKFATMIHSLEHLREPVQFLGHMRNDILADDGYLYIEVPNLYGITLCDPLHFFTYSSESLIRLLNLSGFEVLEMRTSGFPVTVEFTAHNDEQNMICLARPAKTDIVPALATPPDI
ncbi:MAG: class I SAM-dependent methyltransferase [Rhodospirillales bacterium]|nr:class I SAM-dependent methyltransferase [Rhodospirillales bacterium]